MSVVSVEQRGPATILSINRPEKLNAINKQVAVDLQSAFAEFDHSNQRVAILTGAGARAFSAGADVTIGGLAEGSSELAMRPPTVAVRDSEDADHGVRASGTAPAAIEWTVADGSFGVRTRPTGRP